MIYIFSHLLPQRSIHRIVNYSGFSDCTFTGSVHFKNLVYCILLNFPFVDWFNAKSTIKIIKFLPTEYFGATIEFRFPENSTVWGTIMPLTDKCNSFTLQIIVQCH